MVLTLHSEDVYLAMIGKRISMNGLMTMDTQDALSKQRVYRSLCPMVSSNRLPVLVYSTFVGRLNNIFLVCVLQGALGMVMESG